MVLRVSVDHLSNSRLVMFEPKINYSLASQFMDLYQFVTVVLLFLVLCVWVIIF